MSAMRICAFEPLAECVGSQALGVRIGISFIAKEFQ